MMNPPGPPPQPPQPNRLLGPTSGPTDGNVRAVLALCGVLFVHAIFVLILVGYMKGDAADLKDFMIGWGVALYTLDIGAVSYYFGHRNGEQS